MSSREKILAEIQKNKPEALPLPEKFSALQDDGNLVAKYQAVLQAIGGLPKRVEGLEGVAAVIERGVAEEVEVVNGIEGLPHYNIQAYAGKEATAIEAVHTVVLKGELAVAENGSVWVPEANMVNRLLPFLCQQLVLVVSETSVVATMHEAYDRIKVDEDGFGVFIAGPSKTADIEQSLVIGAHGPLSLQVFLISSAAPTRL